MCNGRWLMRDRALLTVDEPAARAAGHRVAEIDAFVMERESSPYNKLVLLSGVQRQESFEVQVKVPIADDAVLQDAAGRMPSRPSPLCPLPPVRPLLPVRKRRPGRGAAALSRG
jgi:hypothetical protein